MDVLLCCMLVKGSLRSYRERKGLILLEVDLYILLLIRERTKAGKERTVLTLGLLLGRQFRGCSGHRLRDRLLHLEGLELIRVARPPGTEIRYNRPTHITERGLQVLREVAKLVETAKINEKKVKKSD